MLAGSSEFIAEARRIRKLLGGGMRQAGILAAAGIVALNEMVERLAEDHANARKLADGLANIPGVAVDPATVESNMVFFGETDGENERLVQAVAAEGLLLSGSDDGRIRAVTHYGISSEDIDTALGIIRGVARA
jgi:threonine aldolase